MRIRKLKEICQILNGSTPDTSNEKYWNGDIYWITPKDVGNGYYEIYDSERKITKEGMKSCTTQMISINSVLLTSRAPVGNIAINKVPLCTNQGFKSLVPGEEIYYKYLFYYLFFFKPKFENLSHGNTFKEITKDAVENIEIPLPETYEEQIAIAEKLDKQMTEIEKMRQAALRQKEAAQALEASILREVFPYKVGDTLPEGWEWKRIGDDEKFELIMGQSPSSETYNKEKIGLPFYQGKADFGDFYPTPTVWCSKPKRVAISNDILLSVRAPVGSINLANEKCCIGRGLAAIRCNENVFFKYLYWLMILFENEISKDGSGSTFDSITKDQVENIEIPLPETSEEQIDIAEKLDKQMAEIEKVRKTVLNQLDAIDSLPTSILRETFKEV